METWKLTNIINRKFESDFLEQTIQGEFLQTFQSEKWFWKREFERNKKNSIKDTKMFIVEHSFRGKSYLL